MAENTTPKSARTIARNARKAELLAMAQAIPTVTVETPPPSPMEGWGEVGGLDIRPVEPVEITPTFQPIPADGPLQSGASEPESGDGSIPTFAEFKAGIADLPKPSQPADLTEAEMVAQINQSIVSAVDAVVNPPVKDMTPITLSHVFGCEEELIFLSIPDPARQEERFAFLKRIKEGLDKVSQSGRIASTGVKDVEKGIDLDREIRLCWGPIGGKTYPAPFNGLPVPAEFEVKTPKLQSGPPKATEEKTGKGRQLKSTRTKQPTVWGQRALLAMERLGPTDGLRAPGGIVSDDDDMVVTPPDGQMYDDLPTDLHKSRTIWAIWKQYDPKGTASGTIRLVRQIMAEEAKKHQPTDRAGLVVIAEGINRQVG
jgi:hypothetical protein